MAGKKEVLVVKEPIYDYYKNPAETLKTELRLRGYSNETIETYVYHNKNFLSYINKSPRLVRASDIKNYIEYLIIKKLDKNSINLAISAILFYFRTLYKRRFNIKRLKKDHKLFPVLSREEIKLILSKIKNPKHKILVEALYSTGLRVSECIKLKIDDFDLNRCIGYAKQGKGKKDRLFILSGLLLKDINEYLAHRKSDSIYLFDTKGSHITRRAAESIVKRYSRLAEIKKNITPHTFRRSFATHLIENKVNIFTVQRLLGHSHVQTTMGYVKNSKVDIEEIKNPLDELYKEK
ncbi:tyrosine-type recombinase/integrase [Candidatus Woesearchaeota archaeon]|nr:tyrosine-type recombinase/integrase [Candidatus Woesearchaeota archaeon]